MQRQKLKPDGLRRLVLDIAADLFNQVKARQHADGMRVTPLQRARLSHVSEEWKDGQREQSRSRAWDASMPEMTELLATYFVVRYGRLVEALNASRAGHWPCWDERRQRYVLVKKAEALEDLQHASNQAFFTELSRKLYREDDSAAEDGLVSLCGNEFDYGGARRWH